LKIFLWLASYIFLKWERTVFIWSCWWGKMTISKINQITQSFFFATEEVGNFYCKKMSTKKFLQTDEFVERLFFFNVSTSFLNQKQKTLPLRKEQNHNIHTVFCSCFLFSLRESILLQSFHETSLEKWSLRSCFVCEK